MEARNKRISYSELLMECMKRGVQVRGPDGKLKRQPVLEKELLAALEKEQVMLDRIKRFAERNAKK